MTSTLSRLFPFLAWRHKVTRATLRADVVAGVISALLVLPQAVAFATLAGLPPQFGLYAAMLPAIVGALWGSSWHLVSGPTNATSLMVFASLSALAVPFSGDYIRLALTLNLLIGGIKLALGLARLGSVTNFISHTVVVGFTAGAALLIIAAQLRNFLGLKVPASASFTTSIGSVVPHIMETDPWAIAVGTLTLIGAVLSRRVSRRVPHLLVGLLAGSVLGWFLNRQGIAHLAMVGAIPSPVPPLSVPEFDPQAWRALAPLALALTLIGLTEAISSSRAVALRSGQRLDGNQEFIGQGLANLVGAFTSSYPSSGSFNRTGANFDAGAQTPMAAVFSAFALFAILLLTAPVVAYLPLAAMAGLLFLVAWGLIDMHTIRRIARTSHAEAAVLAITFVVTLTLPLEFAIFVGVLASLLFYLNRTTHPRMTVVAPDPAVPSRLVPVGAKALPSSAPAIVLMEGSVFFGAVDHVHEEMERVRKAAGPGRRLLLVGTGMNFIDVAGAELLLYEARRTAEDGGALYLCMLKRPVRELLERGGYLHQLGDDRIFDTVEEALAALDAPQPAARATAEAISARAHNP